MVEANPAAGVMHGYTRQDFIGLQLTELIHPDSQRAYREYIREFQSNGVFVARLLHTRQDGTSFYVDWRGTAFKYQDRACLLGVVRDVSQQNQAEMLLRERVETRTHEQDTLLAISNTLASTLELQPSLILEQLREIIEYTHGGLFTVELSS